MDSGGIRKRGPALAMLMIVLALVAGAVFLPASSGRSKRVTLVERMLAASASGDETAFAATVTPNARLSVYFDVLSNSIDSNEFRQFIGKCKAQRFAEGPDTVAVAFDCPRDAMSRFFVDFTFCGDKVGAVTWPEQGRWRLSPMLGDLWSRIEGRKARGACEPMRYGLD